MPLGTFPFGQPVDPVVQADRTDKKVFILGKYSSAVHARWVDSEGKQLVRALAVASEPCIFWCGENVEEIVSEINLPIRVGCLVPAALSNNGPSGRSLVTDYLVPLGLTREVVWLCDLIPFSCMSPGQAKAIRTFYDPLVERGLVPAADRRSWSNRLVDEDRCHEIKREIQESGAKLLITLGEDPLTLFASKLGTAQRHLRNYGKSTDSYGRLHDVSLCGQSMKLLPLYLSNRRFALLVASLPPLRARRFCG